MLQGGVAQWFKRKKQEERVQREKEKVDEQIKKEQGLLYKRDRAKEKKFGFI